jgi:hypothetical protein
METAPSSKNTENRRKQDHQNSYPDVIANFAIGVGSVKKQHVVVDIHAGDEGIGPKYMPARGVSII